MIRTKLCLVLGSALVLSGCSFSLPSEADAAPCQALSDVLSEKIASLPTGSFDAQRLADLIATEVVPTAPQNFQTILEKVDGALKADPVEAGDLSTAATEIAVRCALVGVTVEFPSPQDLLMN